MSSDLVDSSAHNMIAGTEWPIIAPSTTGVLSGHDVASTSSTAIPLPDCDGVVKFEDYSVPWLVAAGGMLLIGLVYTFFGYRFFKMVLFLTGLLFGSGLVFLVCEKERVLPVVGNALLALICGILFGLITMLVEYVGLFMTGFLTGQLLGAAILVTVHSFDIVNSIWITIGVQFLVGLALAQLTLVFQRVLMILGTALIGGALVTAAMDYFGQRFTAVLYTWDVMNVRALPAYTVCWYTWAIVAIWPMVFLTAVLVQFRCTSVGFSHKNGHRLSRKDAHRSSSQRLTEEGAHSQQQQQQRHSNNNKPTTSQQQQPANKRTVAVAQSQKTQSARVKDRPVSPDHPRSPEYKPKSFTSLYQARMKHGDVICQSYMESLRRVYGSNQRGSRGTLTSDSTQMTDLATTFPPNEPTTQTNTATTPSPNVLPIGDC